MTFNPKPGEMYELWNNMLTVSRRIIYILGCYEDNDRNIGHYIKVLNLYDYLVDEHRWLEERQLISNELIDDIFLEYRDCVKVDSFR